MENVAEYFNRNFGMFLEEIPLHFQISEFPTFQNLPCWFYIYAMCI